MTDLGPQLARLAEPFPADLIKTKPGRGNPEYVEHSVVTQRLLEVVGPFSFEVKEVVQTSPCQVLASLTVEVDGKTVTVTEAGQSDNDADLIKSAVSDALKRCAMRLGVGLHLWAQDHYFLADTPAPEPDRSAVEAAEAALDEIAQAAPDFYTAEVEPKRDALVRFGANGPDHLDRMVSRLVREQGEWEANHEGA